MTTYRVLPGARTDYNAGYANELVTRRVYMLYMGGGRAHKAWPDRYSRRTFAGESRWVRDYYMDRTPTVGDTLVMRDRAGRFYRGAVTSRPVELVIPLELVPHMWEWAHRTRAHQERSQKEWTKTDHAEEYVLSIPIAWKEVTGDTTALLSWWGTPRSAIQRATTDAPA